MEKKKETEYKPDPTAMTDFVDTSGTAGIADGRIETASPVFAKARQDTALRVAEYIENGGGPGVVNLDLNDEEAVKAHKQAAEEALKNPVTSTSPNEFQEAAGRTAEEEEELQEGHRGSELKGDKDQDRSVKGSRESESAVKPSSESDKLRAAQTPEQRTSSGSVTTSDDPKVTDDSKVSENDKSSATTSATTSEEKQASTTKTAQGASANSDASPSKRTTSSNNKK